METVLVQCRRDNRVCVCVCVRASERASVCMQTIAAGELDVAHMEDVKHRKQYKLYTTTL